MAAPTPRADNGLSEDVAVIRSSRRGHRRPPVIVVEAADGRRNGVASDQGSSEKVADDSVTKHEEGSPQDVGKSVTRSGEEVSQGEGKEAGRQDAGTQGPTQRPVGTSTMRDSTGIDPQEPRDEESPTLPTGG